MRNGFIIGVLTAVVTACAHAAPASAPTSAPTESIQATLTLSIDYPVELTSGVASLPDLSGEGLLGRGFQHQLRENLKPQINNILHCDEGSVSIEFGGPSVFGSFGSNTQIHNILLIITILHSKAAAPAEEFAKAAADELRQMLQKMDKDQKVAALVQEQQVAFEQGRKASERKNELEQDMELLRKKLGSIGAIDVQEADVAMMARKLDEQRQTTRIEVAAKTARVKALANALDKLTVDGSEKAKADPIAAEMQKLVDATQQKLDLDKQRLAAGLDPNGATETLADQVELSNAKIHLLERRETISRSGMSDKGADLRSQMNTLNVDLAEAKARLDIIDKLSLESATAQQLAAELERKQQESRELDPDLKTVQDRILALHISIATAKSTTTLTVDDLKVIKLGQGDSPAR